MSSIVFHSEDIQFVLKQKRLIRQWLNSIAEQEGSSIIGLSYIFTSDSYLLKINQEYLQHDTYTDVITFPYSEGENIESDIFISIDRCKENASIFDASFYTELHRVMAHALLHLLGYGDKSPDEKISMRSKEDYYLSLRPDILKAL